MFKSLQNNDLKHWIPCALRDHVSRVRKGVPGGCRRSWTSRLILLAALLSLAVHGGCAKYNIYYNAKQAFDDAEHVREEAIKKNEDPPPPKGGQKANYDRAIEKAQRVLEEYPGHSLTDDALFLQAKSWHRLESYRMSIRKLDLLFQNFPATPYLEEALYLQGLNYLLIGAVPRSQDYLDQMVRNFPDSEYRAEVLKVTGDNAYSLESWLEAAEAYRQYLDQDVAIRERDRIGIKLAESYWELEDYQAAAAVLQEISRTAESRELRFDAILLQARVNVRMGDYEVVDVLLTDLKTEADVYKARGDVNLVEAENLIAQDRVEEATPLLENMPEEWSPSPAVKARAQEILGFQYLAASKWTEARKAFRTALNRPKDLDDPEEVGRLSEHLNVFLAAIRALTDADPAEVSRNRLLLANGFRFGFGRPRKAASYYRLAARDTAAEPTVAARALYGAYLTYRDVIDLPDSAAIFAAELDSLYPDSPQAYEARHGRSSNLLGYLLELRDEDRNANYAALSDSEKVALTRLDRPGTGPGGTIGRRGHQLRRRMVYFQRRDHLLFPPTEAETARHQQRVARRVDAAARSAAADTSGRPTPAAETVPPPRDDTFGDTGPPVDAGRSALDAESGETAAGDPLSVEETTATGAEEEEEETEEEEAPKKEVFDLREPGPAPEPGT